MRRRGVRRTDLQLALNVGAMLLAFVGLIALINGLLGRRWRALRLPRTLLRAAPLGLPLRAFSFCHRRALGGRALSGQLHRAKNRRERVRRLSSPSRMCWVTWARARRRSSPLRLTGFANFASLAILLGGLGGIAPSRRADIARLGLYAVAGATLANLMSAAIAGLFVVG